MLHMMSHTGEKPHVCSDCSKGFVTKHELKLHMMIHTGEKPHVCLDCGKAFITIHELKTHNDPALQKKVDVVAT